MGLLTTGLTPTAVTAVIFVPVGGLYKAMVFPAQAGIHALAAAFRPTPQ